jgi:hypothetical protein
MNSKKKEFQEFLGIQRIFMNFREFRKKGISGIFRNFTKFSGISRSCRNFQEFLEISGTPRNFKEF